jgi:formylglycine-generating enzyme
MRVHHNVGIVALGMVTSACSLVTGASGYDDVSHCTGPACGQCPSGQQWDTTGEVCLTASEWCIRQGKRWDSVLNSCWGDQECPDGLRWYVRGGACVPTCSEGTSECGPTCCAAAQYCVTETGGNQRCSACEKPEYECGKSCCQPGVTCVNAEVGVCGATFGVVGQSCAGGLDCGGGVSCCESIAVPGGTFPQGSHDVDAEMPERAVTVSSFSLDKYEVTVGRFRKFVAEFDYENGLKDGAGFNASIPDSGWREAWNKALPNSNDEHASLLKKCDSSFSTWTMSDDTLPINCVTWFEAFAFCAWDGGRLPTEAEWEYAATGGAENRKYPWGSKAPSYDLAVYNCSYDGTPNAGNEDNCTANDIAPMGKKPDGAGRWGHLDLAGNMYEWVLDVYDAYPADASKDYASVSSSMTFARVLRGGSWHSSDLGTLRAANRIYCYSPLVRLTLYGFRCARGQ